MPYRDILKTTNVQGLQNSILSKGHDIYMPDSEIVCLHPYQNYLGPTTVVSLASQSIRVLVHIAYSYQ